MGENVKIIWKKEERRLECQSKFQFIYPTRFKFDTPSFTMDIAVCLLERSFYVQINSYTKTYDSL